MARRARRRRRRRVRPTAHVQTVTHRLRRPDRAPRDRSRSIAIDARDEGRASFATLATRFANANRDRSRGARPATNIPHMADERFWPLFEGLAGAGDGALDGAVDDTLVRATTRPDDARARRRKRDATRWTHDATEVEATTTTTRDRARATND
jgi:hypothetical protein